MSIAQGRIRALLQNQELLGIKRPRRRLPRQIPPVTIEREYTAELLQFIERLRQELAPLLRELPDMLSSAARERARTDAGEGKRARELIDQARQAMRGALNARGLEELAERFARRTSVYNRAQLSRQVHSALGVDIFSTERSVTPLLEGFVSENVSLITNMSDRVIGEIESAVTRAVQNGARHESLAKEIEERFGVAEDRAKLIARDQIGKAYGQINAARQKEMGVRKFIWRTANDERVREEHEEREGEVYSYDNPPEGELPGEPIQCRCYAEPVLIDDEE